MKPLFVFLYLIIYLVTAELPSSVNTDNVDYNTYKNDQVSETSYLGKCRLSPYQSHRGAFLLVNVGVCLSEKDNVKLQSFVGRFVQSLEARWSVECRVGYLLLERCKQERVQNATRSISNGSDDYHNLNDETDPELQSHTAFRLKDIKLKGFNTITINIFREGPESSREIEETLTEEHAYGVHEAYNFLIVSETKPVGGLLQNKESVAGADDKAFVKIKDIGDLLLYRDLKIISKFFCRSPENSVPVEFQTPGGDIVCVCRCASTHKLDVKGNHAKCIRPPKPHSICRWTQTCYVYNVEEADKNGKCVIDNLFDDKVVTVVPFPDDNYVSLRHNMGDAQRRVGPRIELVVWSEKNSTKKETFAFSWLNFQEGRHHIINKFLKFHRVGRYHAQLLAYDYSFVAVTSETTIVIQDHYRPRSEHKCPKTLSGKYHYEGLSGKLDTVDYDQKNIERAELIVGKYYNWGQDVRNDQCGKGKRCDATNNWEKSFGEVNTTERHHLAKCFNLGDRDVSNLKTYFDDRLQLLSSDPSRAEYCVKCCSGTHILKEEVDLWECKGEVEVKCLGNNSCSFTQCLRAHGRTFFEAHSSINERQRHQTKKVIRHLHNTRYNSFNQIHFTIPCHKVSKRHHSRCNVKRRLYHLFDVEAKFTDFKEFFGGQTNPHDFVKFRYRINNGKWRALTRRSHAAFRSYSSIVTIEAWSACGRVHEASYWVYVHPHRKIDVCTEFKQHAIYQTLNVNGVRGGPLCNYPHSDFAEMVFDFDPSHLFNHKDRTHIQYRFNKMICTVHYEGFGDSRVHLLTHAKRSRVFKRYAVDLVHNPITARLSAIEISCTVQLRGLHTGSRQKCHKRITFKDCDAPGWDCPWGECQKACPNGQRRPFQACSGNQISHNGYRTEVRHGYGDIECCKECGGVTCEALSGLPVRDIGRCVPHTKSEPREIKHVEDTIERHNEEKNGENMRDSNEEINQVISRTVISRPHIAREYIIEKYERLNKGEQDHRINEIERVEGYSGRKRFEDFRVYDDHLNKIHDIQDEDDRDYDEHGSYGARKRHKDNYGSYVDNYINHEDHWEGDDEDDDVKRDSRGGDGKNDKDHYDDVGDDGEDNDHEEDDGEDEDRDEKSEPKSSEHSTNDDTEKHEEIERLKENVRERLIREEDERREIQQQRQYELEREERRHRQHYYEAAGNGDVVFIASENPVRTNFFHYGIERILENQPSFIAAVMCICFLISGIAVFSLRFRRNLTSVDEIPHNWYGRIAD